MYSLALLLSSEPKPVEHNKQIILKDVRTSC